MKSGKFSSFMRCAACACAAAVVFSCAAQIKAEESTVNKIALLSVGIIAPRETAAFAVERFKQLYFTQDISKPPETDIREETPVEPEKNAEDEPSPEKPPTEAGGKIKELHMGETNETEKYKNVAFLNSTKSHRIDMAAEMKKGADFSPPQDDKPFVLIFHTHTTEAYQKQDSDTYPADFNPRSLNSNENMIRVGNEICKQLEAAGIGVIHDTNVYDNPAYSGAYDRSGEKIDEYLKKYPSIQVILDIHRDAIEYSDKTKAKPTAVVKDKKAAQLMIISGCQEGDITGFDDWKYNLRFAIGLHEQLETDNAGLMRPLFFAPRKYNMHKSHCSLLIEVGSDGNTLEEAVYSGELLGKSLSKYLLSGAEK